MEITELTEFLVSVHQSLCEIHSIRILFSNRHISVFSPSLGVCRHKPFSRNYLTD